MLRLLSAVIPDIRTRGWLERRELRRLRGRSGVLFSFRGPGAFDGLRSVPAIWQGFNISVDGRVIRESGFSNSGWPFWWPTRPGDYTVEVWGLPKVLLWSGDVHVANGPVVIAVWPKTRGMIARPARVLVDGIETGPVTSAGL